MENTIRSTGERFNATVSETLSEAQVGAKDIIEVFLTGGSTAIPLAREIILDLVPGDQIF